MSGGPFVFDTSAESWLSRDPQGKRWLMDYRLRHLIYVSAATLIERLAGHARALDGAPPGRAEVLRAAFEGYDRNPNRVLAVDHAVAGIAAGILRRLPNPPSPPVRSHQASESKATRIARWRFDVMIAATAMVSGHVLIHNNARDFEAIQQAVEQDVNGTGLSLLRCTQLVKSWIH